MTGFKTLVMLGLLTFCTASFSQTTVQNRIVKNVDNSITFLKDNVHKFARAEFDRGTVESTLPMQRVTMVFKPSSAQQADLDSLLQQQTNPASPNYHKWLTPAQFGKRFGLSDSDFSKVTSWLQSQGLAIVDAPESRTSVSFSATAAQVQSALHTEIHTYVVNGESHYANATSPAVPAAFADVVLGIQSLDNFRPKPRSVTTRVAMNPNFTSSISGNHYLAPDDVATIYNIKGLYNAGYDGSGQKIVVVGQTDIISSDIAAFRAASGLSANLPTVILVPGSSDPGVVKDDIEEANLDLQWSGAIARNASIIYVNSGNGVFDSLQYAITNNLAPVISISYGNCEANFSPNQINALALMGQQANAQGITISAAAGDSGAADCDYGTSTNPATIATQGLAVDIPASMPYVTGIGGTTFSEGTNTSWGATNNSNNGSAQSYIPEIGWNDTAQVGYLSATGGGKSSIFQKPSWQTGTGVPADGARDVPDVSFTASLYHDPYLVCSEGSCVNGYRYTDQSLTVIGGTSAGAPVFAGILALINQKTATTQGNVNPTLYSLAASAPTAFHDVTSGDNKVPCQTGTTNCPSGGTIGYAAGTGYDLVTGLGSVDAFELASALTTGTAPTPDFQLASGSSSLTASTGAPATTTVTITPLNGFDGAVSWSCAVSSTLSSAASCSITPDVSSPNSKATLTVTSLKQTASMQYPSKSHVSWWFATGILPFGMLLVVGGQRRKTVRLVSYGILALLVAISVAGMSGCGGGGSAATTPASSTPTSVTGTVTVQASSGTLVHTIAETVTVQ